ncbi:MAG: hypothetical protein R3C17_10655 [Planctomycetaceae bacterium]
MLFKDRVKKYKDDYVSSVSFTLKDSEIAKLKEVAKEYNYKTVGRLVQAITRVYLEANEQQQQQQGKK